MHTPGALHPGIEKDNVRGQPLGSSMSRTYSPRTHIFLCILNEKCHRKITFEVAVFQRFESINAFRGCRDGTFSTLTASQIP